MHREVFLLNFDCLPLACKRIRELCPTPASMRHLGRFMVRAILLEVFPSIDKSERSHAQYRQGLKSAGPAKSASASSNRVFCRDASKYHNWIGGKLPETLVALLDTEVFKDSCHGAAAEDAGARQDGELVLRDETSVRSNQHLGSVYIAMQNQKMQVAKALLRDGEVLSSAARQEVVLRARREYA